MSGTNDIHNDSYITMLNDLLFAQRRLDRNYRHWSGIIEVESIKKEAIEKDPFEIDEENQYVTRI
jgi:hypothetical protein